MYLSLRPLNAVANVNTFSYSNAFQFTEGDGPALYFQLVDLSLDMPSQGFSPSGRRYCPATGATLQCVVNSLNNSNVVTRFATQPFTNDSSIWMLQLQATDAVRGTADIQLVLTEGTKVTRGIGSRVILANPQLDVTSSNIY